MGTRHLYQGTFKDGNGKVVSGGTVTVYLTQLATLANVYTTNVGGVAVNSVTSNSSGIFSFYIDRDDYGATQAFDITLSKSGFTSQTYYGLRIGLMTEFMTVTNSGSMVHYAKQASLNDEGATALPSSTSGGFGFAQAGDGEEYGLFSYTSAGVVTLISNSANTVATDTDTKFCIYDAGTVVWVKNRLGSAKNVLIMIHYY